MAQTQHTTAQLHIHNTQQPCYTSTTHCTTPCTQHTSTTPCITALLHIHNTQLPSYTSITHNCPVTRPQHTSTTPCTHPQRPAQQPCYTSTSTTHLHNTQLPSYTFTTHLHNTQLPSYTSTTGLWHRHTTAQLHIHNRPVAQTHTALFRQSFASLFFRHSRTQSI